MPARGARLRGAPAHPGQPLAARQRSRNHRPGLRYASGSARQTRRHRGAAEPERTSGARRDGSSGPLAGGAACGRSDAGFGLHGRVPACRNRSAQGPGGDDALVPGRRARRALSGPDGGRGKADRRRRRYHHGGRRDGLDRLGPEAGRSAARSSRDDRNRAFPAGRSAGTGAALLQQLFTQAAPRRRRGAEGPALASGRRARAA